jgi:hypothetical protein
MAELSPHREGLRFQRHLRAARKRARQALDRRHPTTSDLAAFREYLELIDGGTNHAVVKGIAMRLLELVEGEAAC